MIKRRPFLKSLVAGLLGVLGLSLSSKASESLPASDRDKIRPGDLFWDKDRVFTGGSQTLNMVHIVLSADWTDDGEEYWILARFMWLGPGYSRYSGANTREFTDAEVLRMTRVGNIADIKSFG